MLKYDGFRYSQALGDSITALSYRPNCEFALEVRQEACDFVCEKRKEAENVDSDSR